MNINAVYHIWDLPQVWLTTGSKNWGQLENKTDKPAYLLAHPMWHFGLKSALHYHRERRRLKKRNIHLIMLNHCCPINWRKKRLKSQQVVTMDVAPNTVNTGRFKPWPIIIRFSLNC